MKARSHLLSRLAIRLPVSKTEATSPEGIYDEIRGLWLDVQNGVPLVSKPDRPRPRTKKADVETGEDNKGA